MDNRILNTPKHVFFLLLPLLSYLVWIGSGAGEVFFISSLILAVLSVFIGRSLLVTAKQGIEKQYTKLLIGAGLLVFAGLGWHAVYELYKLITGYHLDIFRFHYVNHLPLYGNASLNKGLWGLVLIVFSIVFIWRIIRWKNTWINHNRFPTELFMWFAGSILCFSLSDGPDRIMSLVVHYSAFASDIPLFENYSHVLSTYTYKMPQLSGHNAHYPPGNLILIMVGVSQGLPWLAPCIVIICTLLTLLPIIGIASELHILTYTRNLALVLFISSPAVLSMPSVAMTPIPMLFAATALWLTLICLRRKSIPLAGTVGLLMAACSFFSFTSVIIGLLLVTVTISQLLINRLTVKEILGLCAIAVISFLLPYFLIYLFTEFNLFVCLTNGVEHNKQIMASGYDSIVRYAIRSTGNLIAWLWSIGFVAAVFGIVGGLSNYGSIEERPVAAFSTAVLVATILAAFSTLFFMETERIWLFFIPPWVLVASVKINGSVSTEQKGILLKNLLIFSVLLAVGQELLFQPWK